MFNVKYLYEPKIFHLIDGLKYLPDFYIFRLELYIEIKGTINKKDELKHELFRKQGYKLLVIMNEEVNELNNILNILL